MECHGVVAGKSEAAALVVGGGKHGCVGVGIDPGAYEGHYFVVLDCVVEVADGVVGVAGVVDAGGFDHYEIT